MNLKPFELERYFSKYEFKVKHLLSSSDCESLSIKELIANADSQTKSLWDNAMLSYTESQGHPLLLKEISKLYKDIKTNNILHIVPEEGIYIALRTLIKKDDKVVCVSPCYQSLNEIALSQGAIIDNWEAVYKDGWKFKIDDLRKLVTKDTAMIIINFPHNPTGSLLSKKEFMEVIDIAKQNDCIILSDEMYRFLEFDANDRLPSACETYNNAISLCGLSKSFSMPGARSGWLISKNTDFIQKFRTYKDYTTICASAPSEILSIIALRQKDVILEKNLNIISENLKHLDVFLNKYKDFFFLKKPTAGSICFPMVTESININQMAQKLIDEKDLMILPAKVYNDKSNAFRLGFGRKNFPEVLTILDEWLAEYL